MGIGRIRGNFMTASQMQPAKLKDAAENLFNYATDSNDFKYILKTLPPSEKSRQVTLEYELQLLKILAVGWALSYFMGQKPGKEALAEMFWNLVREFSLNISSVTSLTTGNDIDYFEIIKQRLDAYVHSLDLAGEMSDPAAVIGPEFAAKCKDPENPCAILAGSKMFKTAVNAVKEYLASVQLEL